MRQRQRRETETKNETEIDTEKHTKIETDIWRQKEIRQFFDRKKSKQPYNKVEWWTAYVYESVR